MILYFSLHIGDISEAKVSTTYELAIVQLIEHGHSFSRFTGVKMGERLDENMLALRARAI